MEISGIKETTAEALLTAEEKIALVELLLTNGILKFGAFKTKSGRMSPYFFNFGALYGPQSLGRIGDFLALGLHRSGWLRQRVQALFGPAYKGIPLAVAASMRLFERHGVALDYAYNRKERKDHGEGGVLVGRPLAAGDKVVLIDDVLTGGTSVRESLESLQRVGVGVAGILVAVDRQERGSGKESAAAEIRMNLGLPVLGLLGLREIVGICSGQGVGGRSWISAEQLLAVEEYRKEHGA